MGREAGILAVVTHYCCETWLEQCVESLAAQTRPLEGIVVVDDASPIPPIELLRRFPQVTLLVASENTGPYSLLQKVVDDTDYDGYLLQDADDWSTPDRLAVLLAEAERTGAEMVGCQIQDVFCDMKEEASVKYPLNVNAALYINPGFHPLLMAGSLISRSLIERVGGLATGLRFGGDTEFIHRAAWSGKIVNVPQHCYFRRVHPNAATRHPDTGYKSSMRQSLRRQLEERARQNANVANSGGTPDLRPLVTAGPISLTWALGPALHWSAAPSLAGSSEDSAPTRGNIMASDKT